MLTNVDKYISKFASLSGESMSGRSHYYQIEDKVLRVSDHIGKHSDGCYQIIVKPNGYIIYHPQSGNVSICNYRQVQEFIRTFILLPVDTSVESKMLVLPSKEETILGIPKEAFTEGQLNGIMTMVNKVKSGKNGVKMEQK